MKVYRKISVVSSNFFKKTIWQNKLLQKELEKIVKLQVSSIGLNQKRWKTYNRSIENETVTQNMFVKSKMRFYIKRKTWFLCN